MARFQGLDAKISFLPGALYAVEEGGEVDQLAAGIHEPEVHKIHGCRRFPMSHGRLLRTKQARANDAVQSDASTTHLNPFLITTP